MSRMSDDLISRKALLGTERLLITDIVQNNPTAKYILEQVLYDIEHADTAFDKEKLIEELNSERNLMYREDGTLMGARTQISIDRAVDIVEKGGIE